MKKIIPLLIIFLLQSSYAINEVKKLSLEEAINLALETNPQIKIAKINTDISKNDIKIASKLQNPSIHTFQNMGTSGEGNPQQIGANYMIELFKRGKRKESAKVKASITYDNQKFDEFCLIYEVKKAYIDLLLKKSKLQIAQNQKNLAKELLDLSIKDSNKGNLSKTEAIQAKIAYNRAVMEYNSTKSEVLFSQNRFNTVMNTDKIDYDTKEETLCDNYSSLLTIDPKKKSLTLDDIREFAISNRYDLLAGLGEVESAKSNLKVVKSNRIPDLELLGGWGYQTKGMSDNGAFQTGAYAGVSLVNIPVVYNYKNEIKNAHLEIEKSKLKYEDMKLDILRNVTDAWEKYSIARDNINFYNDNLLSNSKELLDVSIQGFNKKEIDITTFLVSKRLYFDLMLQYQEALAQYYYSFAELLREMNAEMDDFEKV